MLLYSYENRIESSLFLPHRSSWSLISRTIRVKSRFGAFSRPRRVTEAGTESRVRESADGTLQNREGPQVAIAASPFRAFPRFRGFQKCASGIPIRPQTQEPTVGQCVHPVSSYARELHGSETANAYRSLAAAVTYQYRYIHVTLPTRYARVPVRQTWTSIDISSHPRPRKGPTSRGKRATALRGSSVDKSVSRTHLA